MHKFIQASAASPRISGMENTFLQKHRSRPRIQKRLCCRPKKNSARQKHGRSRLKPLPLRRNPVKQDVKNRHIKQALGEN